MANGTVLVNREGEEVDSFGIKICDEGWVMPNELGSCCCVMCLGSKCCVGEWRWQTGSVPRSFSDGDINGDAGVG
jgi:hypothetical protein